MKRILKTFDIMGLTQDDVALNLFEYGLSSSGRDLDIALCARKATVIHFGIPQNEKWDVTLKAIKRIKPNVLIATVSMIHKLLKHVKCESIEKIYTTGSLVTPSFVKDVKQRWNCRVFNLYGCNEVGPIAFGDAEEPCLKLIDDGLYVEVLKSNDETSRTGRGKILITDLNNFSIPMIRYVLGDEVEITEKDNERLLRVFGRADKFTNINCDVIPINMLIKSIMDCIGHEDFLIVIDNDKGNDSLEARIRSKDEPKIPEMTWKVKRLFGLDMSFTVSDGKFPTTSSGKSINYVDKRKLKLEDKKLNW